MELQWSRVDSQPERDGVSPGPCTSLEVSTPDTSGNCKAPYPGSIPGAASRARRVRRSKWVPRYHHDVLGRKKEEKQQREAEDLALLERLTALSPEELAVELLPVFSAETAKHVASGASLVAVRKALLDGHIGFRASAAVNRLAVGLPMREAAQLLEHANLIVPMGTSVAVGESDFRITAKGTQALADGTVAEILGRASA